MAQDRVHLSFLTVTAYEYIFLNMYIQVGVGLNTLRVQSSLQNKMLALDVPTNHRKLSFHKYQHFYNTFHAMFRSHVYELTFLSGAGVVGRTELQSETT